MRARSRLVVVIKLASPVDVPETLACVRRLVGVRQPSIRARPAGFVDQSKNAALVPAPVLNRSNLGFTSAMGA
jgi:hypothetical protein